MFTLPLPRIKNKYCLFKKRKYDWNNNIEFLNYLTFVFLIFMTGLMLKWGKGKMPTKKVKIIQIGVIYLLVNTVAVFEL